MGITTWQPGKNETYGRFHALFFRGKWIGCKCPSKRSLRIFYAKILKAITKIVASTAFKSGFFLHFDLFFGDEAKDSKRNWLIINELYRAQFPTAPILPVESEICPNLARNISAS